MIKLGWNFNLSNPNYSGIPSTVGTYVFTNSSNCSYTISVPVPELNTTTTTTQAYAGGITSSSTTTTTTASCVNSLTATPNPFNNPTTVTFVGSPIGPYSVMFTELDSGIQYYLGAGIKTPWVFDRKNYYIGAINSSYGTYKFISPTCTINIPVIRVTTSTSTTSTSTSTTSTTTAPPTSTTTAAPTTTVAFQTLTGYSNSTSNKFCAQDQNVAFTVYTSAGYTLATAAAYNIPIFSNTALTTPAAPGIYGTSSGGSGVTWYEWNGELFTNNLGSSCPEGG